MVRSYSFDPDSESPAKKAGIEPGDVIISADGKPTDRVSTLQRIVRSHKPGETVTFEVMRFGEKKTFQREARRGAGGSAAGASSARPDVRRARRAAPEARRFDKIGIAVEPVSPEP